MSKIIEKDRFYYNRDFLGSSQGRSIRILSEYYGPLQKLKRNKIVDTIVFFGSAYTGFLRRESRSASVPGALDAPDLSTMDCR